MTVANQTITLKPATDPAQRCAYIRSAMLRGLQQVRLLPAGPESMVLAAYGPSLVDTWERLRGRQVYTVSGAHDFLIERGIIPVGHIDAETRPHKAKMLKPHPQVRYFVASCSNPAMFDILSSHEVRLWHSAGSVEEDREIRVIDPDGFMVLGGSTVALRALCLGTVLGYRAFEIHGMDCSFRDVVQHAGEHLNMETLILTTRLREGGPAWQTSPQMIAQVQDFLVFVGKGYKVTLHDGLTRSLLRAICEWIGIPNLTIMTPIPRAA